MKIIIAPDSFKESLSAVRAAAALARGLRRSLPDAHCVVLPIGDGGEGTLAALLRVCAGRWQAAQVSGPLGDPVSARYALLDDGATAMIEMAEASGLMRLPAARRDPLRASTLGTGQLMRHALEQGARRIVIGVGGSATNDGGAGMLQALGVRFFDRSGALLGHALGGGDLAQIADFDACQLTTLLNDVDVEVMCDVDNPLCGPRGASATFGPQKGADTRTVQRLDHGLEQFFALVEARTGAAVSDRPGAGAAGGLAAALMALCGARARPGIEVVLEAVGFERHLDGATLVITAEGCVDGQTGAGKAPLGVARAAAARGVPVLVIGGALADGAEDLLGVHFAAMEAAVTRPQALSEALAGGRGNLERAGQRVGAWLQLARCLAARER